MNLNPIDPDEIDPLYEALGGLLAEVQMEALGGPQDGARRTVRNIKRVSTNGSEAGSMGTGRCVECLEPIDSHKEAVACS